MKRFAFILTVLLGMVSCSKEARITGSWKIAELTVSNITLNLDDIDLNLTITFSQDGKMVSNYSLRGISASDEYTYSIGKETLIIDETELDYELNGKILTIYGEGDLLGMEGNIEVVFHKI